MRMQKTSSFPELSKHKIIWYLNFSRRPIHLKQAVFFSEMFSGVSPAYQVLNKILLLMERDAGNPVTTEQA